MESSRSVSTVGLCAARLDVFVVLVLMLRSIGLGNSYLRVSQ